MGTYKTCLTAVILAAVLTGSGYTQSNSIKDITAHKYALDNLIAGIHSENDGVRRNSIYFAGYYKIVEAEDALIAQLKEEKDPSTRILISLVLFELGSEEGLLEVKDLSLNDKDAKVRRMSTQIYSEYLVNEAASTVYVTE
ncbi:MAG TPA: HEAT repeat domain-containing protein [Ignavibacteriaceae bacterium]